MKGWFSKEVFLVKKCVRYDEGKVKYGGKHLLHNFGPIVKYPRSWLTARNCHNFALFHHWRGATLNRFGTKIEITISAHQKLDERSGNFPFQHTVHLQPTEWKLTETYQRWVSRHLNSPPCTFSTAHPSRKICKFPTNPKNLEISKRSKTFKKKSKIGNWVIFILYRDPQK